MYKISQEHRQLLLKYLSTRPYAEVFQLVAIVVGLKPETNSKDKDKVKEEKKNWCLKFVQDVKAMVFLRLRKV